MPLTAADPEGRPIFPFASGINRARCRDTNCAAAMAAIPAVGSTTDPIRVAHWRHIVRSDTCPTVTRDRDRVTEWHRRWQTECVDADRVEVRVERDGKHRVADVMTRFGWAVEFQHSPIGRRTYQDRTDHYRGRVVWVFDFATDTYAGDFAIEDRALAWLDRRKSNTIGPYRDGLIFLDAGDVLWLLPPGKLGVGRDGNARIPVHRCARWSRSRFADRWLNGDVMPLEEPVATSWQLDRIRQAAAAAVAAPVVPRVPRPRRPVEDTWQCRFDGDRDQLVRDQPLAERREVVADLTGRGMSTRAIGSVLGVSNATVSRDQETVTSVTVPDTVTSLDGKIRPRSPITAEAKQRADELAPGICRGYRCQQEIAPGTRFCPDCYEKGTHAASMFTWNRAAAVKS